MKHAVGLVSFLVIAGCAGPQDELRLARLSDGRTEIAMPYSTGTAMMESSGFPTDALIAAKAKSICPNGYEMSYQGLRQRPEYADPEKIWNVRCSSSTQ